MLKHLALLLALVALMALGPPGAIASDTGQPAAPTPATYTTTAVTVDKADCAKGVGMLAGNQAEGLNGIYVGPEPQTITGTMGTYVGPMTLQATTDPKKKDGTIEAATMPLAAIDKSTPADATGTATTKTQLNHLTTGAGGPAPPTTVTHTVKIDYGGFSKTTATPPK